MDQSVGQPQHERVIEMTRFTGQQHDPPPPPVTNNPLNSVYFIAIDFVMAIAQILASIIVLVRSTTHEKAPLVLMWVIVYASGCMAFIPLLVYRFCTLDTVQQQPGASSNAATTTTTPMARFVEHYLSFGLYCFFVLWFAFGCILVFGADSSIVSQAPNLYRLSVALLIFGAFGLAMPYIFCVSFFCYFPYLFYLQDILPERGASKSSIRSLPTFKFEETESGGGVVNQRLVTAEDAVCAICLEIYANGDDIKELPCNHVYHEECVDQWLKLNPACPLCKHKTGKRAGFCCWLCR